MRVLIIGGTGLTGPLIVEYLLSHGHEVTIYHTGAHERQFSMPVPHIHGDRRDYARFKQQMAAIDVDAVIDMAAMN